MRARRWRATGRPLADRRLRRSQRIAGVQRGLAECHCARRGLANPAPAFPSGAKKAAAAAAALPTAMPPLPSTALPSARQALESHRGQGWASAAAVAAPVVEAAAAPVAAAAAAAAGSRLLGRAAPHRHPKRSYPACAAAAAAAAETSMAAPSALVAACASAWAAWVPGARSRGPRSMRCRAAAPRVRGRPAGAAAARPGRSPVQQCGSVGEHVALRVDGGGHCIFSCMLTMLLCDVVHRTTAMHMLTSSFQTV
eukprot:358891-Chlamydomonas_euryale.AAC.5